MMKTTVLASALLLALGSAEVMAQACPAGLTGAQLVTTLSGKYVCARRAPGNAAEDIWNELHQGTTAAGGPIMDYKRGPTDPVDPSKVVGSYSISLTDNTVTYNYGDPCSPYTYTLSPTLQVTPESPAFLFCQVSAGSGAGCARDTRVIAALITASPNHAFCMAP